MSKYKFPSLETIQNTLMRCYIDFKNNASVLDGVDKEIMEQKAKLIADLCYTWFKVDIDDII